MTIGKAEMANIYLSVVVAYQLCAHYEADLSNPLLSLGVFRLRHKE